MFKYIWLYCLVLGFGLLSQAGWAATISVTPNQFQEDYQGWLNLTVSGMPAGDVALIKLAGDQNQNGALDSNDVVYLQWMVTDGVPAPIDHSTIVADSDGAANGTITARFSVWDTGFPAGKILVLAEGRGFSWSAVALCQVTPQSTAQSISGTIRDDEGQPLCGLVSALLEDESNEWMAFSKPDGTYTLYVSVPGAFMLGGYRPNYINYLEAGARVTLLSGQHLNGVDLTLSRGTTKVSGHIYDASTGQGLEGMSVYLDCEECSQEWESQGFTDVHGNFTLPAFPSGNDEVVFSIELSEQDYVGNNEYNLVIPPSGLSGLQFPLEKATTFITGRIYRTDTGEGVPGLEIEATQPNVYLYSTSVEDGYYAVCVMEGNWSVALAEETEALRLGLFPAPQQYISLNPGETKQNVDIPLDPANATVDVLVEDSHNQSLQGIEVAAFGPDGPRSVWQMQATGTNGHVVFPVIAGTYWIWPVCEELIAGKYQCVSGQNITVVTGETRALAITLSLLPGDTNGDGRVDVADLFHFAQHWNEPADANNLPCNPIEDSQIDGQDLLMLMKQW